ncbi:MAG: class F sortase [Dehalococcoidia bacterium]
MRASRIIPLAAFGAGLVTIALTAACGGGGDSPTPTAATTTEASPTATPSATATTAPTATPTKPPTPTPTPTPFAGDVSRLKFSKFGIDAPIEQLAINSRNELDTPKDENRAVGWYHIYDRPGWNGNSLFSAHVYYRNVAAPFQRLAQSKEGDELSVVMADGTEYKYRVITNKRYHRDTMPMGDIIWPPERPAEKEWITLITCGGQLDDTGQEYISRDVIVAERFQ